MGDILSSLDNLLTNFENIGYIISTILVIYLNIAHRKSNKVNRREFDTLKRELKRLELVESIRDDLGLRVEGKIYGEYKAMNGNSYGDTIHNAYVQKKIQEEKEKGKEEII